MFKLVDLWVRFGKILKVAEIKGDSIEMRPFFNLKSSNGLTYSIQTQNLDSGKIRKLITKEKLQQLLQLLKNASLPTEINVLENKLSLNTQDLGESLQLLKTLWHEKQNHAGFLPGGRLSLYQQTLAQASDEVAAVKGILPEEAKRLILTSLK